MKGLRTWIGLFFAIVLGLSLAACGGNSKQEATDQKVRDEAVAKAAAEQQKQREETQKKAEAERKQEQERERAERRAEAVKNIRAAFDPKAEAPVGDQPAWVGELRRGSPQPASEACAKLEKFGGVDWAFREMDREDEEGRISWTEIGLEKNQAQKIHRETGLAAAKSILTVFTLPRETRRKMRCGRGEGTFDLDDGLRLMQEITRILQGVEAEPKAIGSSPATLRQVLLKDLREQIVYLRVEIKAGRVKESDGGVNAIRYVVHEATREWDFTPKELGLTTEEVAMLQKKE